MEVPFKLSAGGLGHLQRIAKRDDFSLKCSPALPMCRVPLSFLLLQVLDLLLQLDICLLIFGGYSIRQHEGHQFYRPKRTSSPMA